MARPSPGQNRSTPGRASHLSCSPRNHPLKPGNIQSKGWSAKNTRTPAATGIAMIKRNSQRLQKRMASRRVGARCLPGRVGGTIGRSQVVAVAHPYSVVRWASSPFHQGAVRALSAFVHLACSKTYPFEGMAIPPHPDRSFLSQPRRGMLQG